jgi:hypothetical protein
LAPVGGGASSNVFRALGPQGETVAVKLLSGLRIERRLQREIEAYTRLRHPNLLELLDAGSDSRHGSYLVMPFIEGRTMRELGQTTRLCQDAALVLALPLLAGLGAMHEHGFIHRDLKPENVMVTDRGRLVVVDLGLSLRDSQSRLTGEGAVAGSVPYMSPEQIEGHAITVRSDIWSVGVILYELVAGRRPFQRPLPGEEVAAILSTQYVPLDQADRRVSESFSSVVHACLSAHPAERPADAAALTSRLKELARSEGPAHPENDLAYLLARPRDYVEARACSRCSELRQKAVSAIQTGDSFHAFEAIDRALAYCPGERDLQELIEHASALAAPVTDEEKKKTRRRMSSRLWTWAAAVLSLLAVALAILFWPEGQERQQELPAVAPKAEDPRSKAAGRKFYSSAGNLAKLLVRGMKQQAIEKDKAKSENEPRMSEADRVVLDLAGNFSDILIDVGTHEEITVDGQEASAELLGNMLKLIEMGVKEEANPTSPRLRRAASRH